MHSIKFHNIGNADSTLITLENGRRVLFDYADTRDRGDKFDLRCDLPAVLRESLGRATSIDVVAFTHLDRDHYLGATEFFYFEHIQKYQDDVGGKKRIKMDTLWVPAAAITERLAHSDDVEAKAIQMEARERFKAGKGIRVFSRPDRLIEWCEKNSVDFETRRHLTTDAGRVAPEFSLKHDRVEFFVHSPFAVRQNECTVEDRNTDSLVMQATFISSGLPTRVMLAADVGHAVLTDIVKVTEAKSNQVRLEWDIFKLPHHCSYLTLGDEKGKNKTIPEPAVKRLFEDYGQEGATVVSTSDTIPQAGDDRDTQQGALPPHRQAANYHREDVTAPKDGEFIVTMEHPSKHKPSPLTIEIVGGTATVRKAVATVSAVAAAKQPHRAG